MTANVLRADSANVLRGRGGNENISQRRIKIIIRKTVFKFTETKLCRSLKPSLLFKKLKLSVFHSVLPQKILSAIQDPDGKGRDLVWVIK